MNRILIAAGLLASLVSALPTVVIREKSGSAQSDAPITLSLGLIEGEVSTPLKVLVDGAPVASQTDLKRHWPGGSIKHALVSFAVPALAANGSARVTFEADGTTDTNPVSVASILATDFDAQALFTIGGHDWTVSARDLLASGEFTYWLKGPVATEFILRGRPKDDLDSVSPDIMVQMCVRFYSGLSRARVSFEPENVVKTHRQDVDYDVTLSVGNASKTQVYSKTAVKHYNMSRWRKVFNWGEVLPETEIRLDVPYLISTGLVQRYDTASVPSESQLAGRYQSWLNSNHDILQNGLVADYFGMTGARDEIGPQPRWTAEYIVSQDNRAKAVSCGHGDLSGSFSIHWRESDSVRTLSLFTYPTFTLDNWQWANDKPPTPTGPCTTPYSVDGAHQPCFAYIPYLMTGDYYYLEEMYYWANWNIIKASVDAPSRPLHSLGILADQIRGVAWTFRSFVEAAALAPDNDFEKAYFDSLTRNNIDYHMERLLGTVPDNVMGWWQTANLPNKDYCDFVNGVYCTSPFETDFVSVILDHAMDLGYESARPLRDFTLKFLAGRFSGNGLPPYCGTPYRMPTAVIDSSSPNNRRTLSTWAEVHQVMGSPSACELAYPTCSQCYSFIARAALTASNRSQTPDADKAFMFLDTVLDVATVNASDLTFALMPGPERVSLVSIESRLPGSQADAALFSASPNPFNSSVSFKLAAKVAGTLAIYDLLGRKIAVSEVRKGMAVWNGRDIHSRPVAAGIYVAVVKAGDRTQKRHLFLVR